MFLFKAAVLGAGTMGAEITDVIAPADVPVVLDGRVAAFLGKRAPHWNRA